MFCAQIERMTTRRLAFVPLPPRARNLRLFAHTRRILLSILPLGAAVGLAMTLVVLALDHLVELLGRSLGHSPFRLALPFSALALCTLWLTVTRTGEVSLFEDLDLAKHSPYEAFPFWRSLAKVVGCGFTICLGGSTGLEGPAKWLGAALGVQFHRGLGALARRVRSLRHLRHFRAQSLPTVTAGAAAAVAVVFRAPLSGALFAAEHDGHLRSEECFPAVVAAAAGYAVFVALAGSHPLLPFEGPYQVGVRELLTALPLGLVCGLGASLFLAARAWMRRALDGLPLWGRGLAGGLGLALLAVPGHVLFHDLPITQRGGLELVVYLLQGPVSPARALLFMTLKILATALTLAAGGVGGMWLCTIAMGAALGSALGAWLLPGWPGLMPLLGAAAFAGASHRTLLVPTVFLAETTGQAGLVVPAILACTLAVLVVRVHLPARPAPRRA